MVDVLERVLDKGIVIDAWIAVSVIGIELITIEARIIVASVETYVKYSEALGYFGPIAGGFRERKSLGEGLKEVKEGLGLDQLPILGQGGEKREEGREEAKAQSSRGKAERK